MPDDAVQQEADKIGSTLKDQGVDRAYDEVSKYANDPANKDKLAALHTVLAEKNLLPELTFKHLSAPVTTTPTQPVSSHFARLAGPDGFIDQAELEKARAASAADQLLLPTDSEIKDIANKDKTDNGDESKISKKDLAANAKEGKERREKPVGLGASTPKKGEVEHLSAEEISKRFGDKFSEGKTGVKLTRMDIAHFPEGDLKIGYNGDEQVLYDGNNLYAKLPAGNPKAKAGAGFYQLTANGQSLGDSPYKMPHEKYHYDEQNETFLSCDNDGVKTKGWRTKDTEIGGQKFAGGAFEGRTLPSGNFIHSTGDKLDFMRYPDGSFLLPKYGGDGKLSALTEKKKDADKKTDVEERWVRDDATGDFKYIDGAGNTHVRKGVELDQKNGILTFKNSDGKNVIRMGDKTEIVQEANAPKLTFDAQGRQSVSDPEKTGIRREFTYVNDSSLQLKSIKEVEKKDGTVRPESETVTERKANQQAGQPPQFVCTYKPGHPQQPKQQAGQQQKPNEVVLQGEHYIDTIQQYVRPERLPDGKVATYVANPKDGKDLPKS